MKPKLDKCIKCDHEFVVAVRGDKGNVCLTCKMNEDVAKKDK